METVQTTIRLPADLHALLVRIAQTESRSFNGQLIYIVRQYAAQHPPAPGARPD